MRHTPTLIKDLVLVGGGHSHAIALRMFGMNPCPGVRLTLISDASDTPYSGMLPGHVAGFYSHDECHIDLRPLCQFVGAQFYVDRAIGLDLENQQVLCANHPPIRFDLLSLDIGSTPKMPSVLGDLAAIIPAKPVRLFLQSWQQIVEHVAQNPHLPLCLGIVGGGAGGVELALTMQSRIQGILQRAHMPLDRLTLHLFQRDAELMPNHNRWVRQHFRQLLSQRGIQLHFQEEVREVQAGRLVCRSGLVVECDHIFWVTQAAAPDWLGKAGLQVDEAGFVQVDDRLRSLSHPQVFASGDIATMVNHPRPKAGVFAVRQGKPLFHNLRRALQQQPLLAFRPQKHYLSLIGTGDGSAVASRGPVGWQAPLLWQWKDRIDRGFMDRFSRLPEMGGGGDAGTRGRGERETRGGGEGGAALMRCAGCGSKVGSGTLERVLQRIQNPSAAYLPSPNPHGSSILVGLNGADDAAVIRVPTGMAWVQTVDYFPALVDDPFVFGQIAAQHALSDLFAMGAQPHSALAIATIPYANPAIAEETLYQLLSGAIVALRQANAELIGGHTTEGRELAFGLACNGLADPDRLLRKGGMQPGQVLILTKALGTGALLAAQMRLQAKGRWIDGAIASMLQSNQQAAACLLEHGATACTDITGFGLVGHLLEMIRASAAVAVQLDLAAVPLLDGALEVSQAGITSSLYPQNSQAIQAIEDSTPMVDSPQFPLLFDPQTSGGLLAAVPEAMADRCLSALKHFGYTHSTMIGKILPAENSVQRIQILPRVDLA